MAVAPSTSRRDEPPATSCISTAYLHPLVPQSVTTYARVFPSSEMSGNDTRPVLVICVRSLNVTGILDGPADPCPAIHSPVAITAAAAAPPAIHSHFPRVAVATG